MPSASRVLSGLEEEILLRLLNAGVPGHNELLAQVKDMKVRQIDAEGSLRLEPRSDAPAATVDDRIPVEAEFPDNDGISVRVLLHVVNGFLSELEIYKDDLTPIQSSLQPSRLRLVHRQT